MRRIITNCIDLERKAHGFRLLGYVVMPEHIHLVLVPRLETQVGRLIGNIKRESSQQIHELLKKHDSFLIKKFRIKRDGLMRFALWQRRCFDHNCRTDEAVVGRVLYCHENPVKRGLVHTPDDWRWSSYRWYRGQRDVPLIMDVNLDGQGAGND
ncbi:transposase [Candidatus Zixiibacteriota bacterium]